MKTTLPHWISKTWWKYTALLLLSYILIGGLIVPLGAGLEAVSPVYFDYATPTSFSLKGYNTHFKSGANTQLFFRQNGKYLCVDKVTVVNEDELTFETNFKGKLASNRSFDLIVNNDMDGTIALRDAVSFKPDNSEDSTVAIFCEPIVKNNIEAKFSFPYREILYESIRNTFYHVPMWFGMLAILLLSLVFSIRYLSTQNIVYDTIASSAVVVALLAGVLGLTTGMMWANYTWGAPWPNDPKLNGAAVGVLIYVAYIVLRGAIPDTIKKARISAVYNVFAIVIYILFIFIIPRITDSLHPGNGGNPAFSKYDLDSHLRLFFYPAVIAWVLLFLWLTTILVRIRFIETKIEDNED
jgi:heme exporter protein C